MDAQKLQERLAETAREHGIPGLVIAVQRDEEIVEAAHGVLDKEFNYPVTTDSIFQTGSITKVWTATLLMQLVDEGLVDLDAPVARYLPGFRVADETVSATVTVRQLLCHVGGFEGDIFDDHGPGDDAVERYVACLAGPATQLFPNGTMWSYCNSGYVVLGRIVEVLTGLTWEAALRERIALPLGMTHVVTSPAEAIRHRVAMGHVTGPDGDVVKAPIWAMPRSNAPAGSTLTLTARDQLRFAKMHLSGGVAPDGTRVLSEESVRAMREPQVAVPVTGTLGDHWGLGWELFECEGGQVIGHDGGTVGQLSLLRVVPGKDVAVAVLTNGGAFFGLHALVTELLDELAGVRLPPLHVPPAEPAAVDTGYFTGRYESGTLGAEVTETDEGLSVVVRPLGAAAALHGEGPLSSDVMVPLDARTLVGVEPQDGRHVTYTFLGDGEKARFLHLGRAVPRV
ncbi:serine hydrolase domain-containing protein [Sphaerisporangium fuscum]|uniref:serine hydrolase domain-containing protein n=1 Tax=Sphaerisporangium fuscum TaxID=2835868 RepID=UPI001BDC120C|nr:serine hydrolase domain-containing protein [Sphaerisporangium fuscum]